MNISINGIDFHVTDQGVGAPTIIFLHYWGGSSRTWQYVIAGLSSRYRCVAPDLRGWGHSGAPSGDAYALRDFAADIKELIATLGVQEYVLVGHSMGGKIAQLLASYRPTGLLGLVLVAPAPPTPLALAPDALAGMQSAYASPESVGAAIDQLLTAKPLDRTLREQVIEDSLRGTEQAKLAWPGSTSLENISGALAAIDVPVLVIAGELDRIDSLSTLRVELLGRLPFAELHVLAGTGHLSPLESPREVAQHIGTFVDQFARARR